MTSAPNLQQNSSKSKLPHASSQPRETTEMQPEPAVNILFPPQDFLSTQRALPSLLCQSEAWKQLPEVDRTISYGKKKKEKKKVFLLVYYFVHQNGSTEVTLLVLF